MIAEDLKPDPLLKPYANQLIRASSSVGANYRAKSIIVASIGTTRNSLNKSYKSR